MTVDALEKELEAEIVALLHANGWWQMKVERANKRGVPDRVAIRDGEVVWLEIKRRGREPSDQQRLRHKEMRAAGAAVYVLDSLDAARRLLS